MQTFHIVTFYPSGAIHGEATFTGHDLDTPMTMIAHATKCYTWARGYIADGVLHSHNPTMLVNGVPAVDIVAAYHAAQQVAA
jgi:hypothetical protein